MLNNNSLYTKEQSGVCQAPVKSGRDTFDSLYVELSFLQDTHGSEEKVHVIVATI